MVFGLYLFCRIHNSISPIFSLTRSALPGFSAVFEMVFLFSSFVKDLPDNFFLSSVLFNFSFGHHQPWCVRLYRPPHFLHWLYNSSLYENVTIHTKTPRCVIGLISNEC